jgi:hypothetical protein
MVQKVHKKYPNIFYVVFDTHSNCTSWGPWRMSRPYRSRYLSNDGEWVAYNQRLWTDNGRDVPPTYVHLLGSLEGGYNLNHLGFRVGEVKIFMFISCYSLRIPATYDNNWDHTYYPDEFDYETHYDLWASYNYPYSDVCRPLGITTSKQIALGSGGAVISDEAVDPYYSYFFNSIWDEMSTFGKSFEQAIPAAMNHIAYNNNVRKNFRYRGAGVSSTSQWRSLTGKLKS